MRILWNSSLLEGRTLYRWQNFPPSHISISIEENRRTKREGEKGDVQLVSPLWGRKGKLPRNELLVQWRWKGEEGRGGDQVRRKTGEEDWNEERERERGRNTLIWRERERIEQKSERGWRREEHSSRVQLRNGFGFVGAFWIKVREETIAVRSSLSISFPSFFFLLLPVTFTLFPSFNYTRGCKRRNRRGDLVSLDVSCLSKVCQLLLHWSWLFQEKKLGMTSFLRFRDGTERVCVC